MEPIDAQLSRIVDADNPVQKINITAPWAEFYEENKNSYNFTLAEPTKE